MQGTPGKDPVSLRLGFAGDDFGYAIDLGLPTRRRSAFGRDPEIKRECVWNGNVLRPSRVLVDRRGRWCAAARAAGELDDRSRSTLPTFDSMMTALRRPAAHARDADAARADARLALLRSLPDRRARAGAPAADRHAHAGARVTMAPTSRRRCRRSARSATPRRSTRRSTTPFPASSVSACRGERLVRGGDAAARPAPPAEGRRALRRHAALPAAGSPRC